MGGGTPLNSGGSSTNITVHLFLLIAKPERRHLITSLRAHMLIRKSSFRYPGGYMHVFVCV